MRRLLSLIATAFLLMTSAVAAGEMRLITIGAPVTELAFALGAGPAVVGRDTVSRYPAEALRRPDIGYMRALSAEGMMSLNPTHVLAVEGAGPQTTFDQLRAMGVNVAVFPEATDRAGLTAKIAAVAKALGREAEGRALAVQVEEALSRLTAAVDHARGAGAAGLGARVLCLVGAGPGGILAAGGGTVPDKLMTMAGARNAMAGNRDYVSLSAEAALAAEPDLLLVSQSLITRSGGVEALLALPQLAMTPAARDRRVVAVDGALLVGLGPRAADVVAALAKAQNIGGIP